MAFVLLGLFLLAALLPAAVRRFGSAAVIGAALLVAAAGGAIMATAGGAWDGPAIIESRSWLPELGLDLSFRLDGLSLLFALLITTVGAFVFLYASSYLAGHPRLGYFTAVLMAFTASMLGLVLSDNVVLLFVFWELTSITSFLLIGFDDDRAKARRAATQALLITGSGGLALLAGILVLAMGAGSFSLTDILATSRHNMPGYDVAAVLILVAAFTKSAAYPFHVWLPNAMEAPTPVSALLHSSTMVKAGVYLLARLHPGMAGTDLWDGALFGFGGATMLLAAFASIHQREFKKVLAYSTVSSLGALMMLLGLGAVKAAAMYLLAHAAFKACLFLVAGSVIHATHEKDPEKLGGLRRVMPLTAAIAAAAGLSMAGMFPTLGFVGKELLLKAGLAHPSWAGPATAIAFVAAIFTVFAAILVSIRPFWGQERGVGHAHESNPRELAGPLLFALASLVLGVLPFLLSEPVARGMLAAIDGGNADTPIKVSALALFWPPTTATILSVAALGLGSGLFLFRRRFIAWTAPLAAPIDRWPDQVYDRLIDGLFAVANLHTRFMQGGTLRRHIRVVLTLTAATIGLAVVRMTLPILPSSVPVDILSPLLGIGLVVSACGIVVMRTAMGMVAVLGVVGFVISIMFAQFAVPDVALTQLAVETLIVVIFVLAILHLPETKSISARRSRVIDAVIAIGFGGAIATLAMAAATRATPNPIADYFAIASVPEGFGRNVVNVILVDFRALDTLGEITVLGVAAVGVAALARGLYRRGRRRLSDRPATVPEEESP